MTKKAVIWDFGGVFTTSPFEAFNRYENQHGLPRDLIRTVNSTNPDSNAWALFERGAIDSRAFDRKFLEESAALGHPCAELTFCLCCPVRYGLAWLMLC